MQISWMASWHKDTGFYLIDTGGLQLFPELARQWMDLLEQLEEKEPHFIHFQSIPVKHVNNSCAGGIKFSYIYFRKPVSASFSTYWMKPSLEVSDNVIVRRFVGDISQEDIIESWNELLARYQDLGPYRGLVIDLLNARLIQDRNKFQGMVAYLKQQADRLQEKKIAYLMDTPQVTHVILLDHQIRQLQIRPFATLKGALDWIRI